MPSLRLHRQRDIIEHGEVGQELGDLEGAAEAPAHALQPCGRPPISSPFEQDRALVMASARRRVG